MEDLELSALVASVRSCLSLSNACQYMRGCVFGSSLLSLFKCERSLDDEGLLSKPVAAPGGQALTDKEWEDNAEAAGSKPENRDAFSKTKPAPSNLGGYEEKRDTLEKFLEKQVDGQSETDDHPSAAGKLLPLECGSGSWRLENTGVNTNRGEDFTNNERLTPVLEKIERCASEQRKRRFCLGVRGHSDTIGFSLAVISAYGSAQAARIVRTRSRSIMVINKLYRLGDLIKTGYR